MKAMSQKSAIRRSAVIAALGVVAIILAMSSDRGFNNATDYAGLFIGIGSSLTGILILYTYRK